MMKFDYTKVEYSELDNWLTQNVKDAPEGSQFFYNLEITGLTSNELNGGYSGQYEASPLSKLLDKKAKKGTQYNIKIEVPANINFDHSFQNSGCTRSVKATGGENVYNLNSFFTDSGIQYIDVSEMKSIISINCAFENCYHLKELVLPPHVENIVNIHDAFYLEDKYGTHYESLIEKIYTFSEDDKKYICDNWKQNKCKLNIYPSLVKVDKSIYNINEKKLSKYVVVEEDDLDNKWINNENKNSYRELTKIYTTTERIPYGATDGTIWYNPNDKKIYVYDEHMSDSIYEDDNPVRIVGRNHPATKTGRITAGTYERNAFWNLLKQYVPRGTYRSVSSQFNVTVEGSTVSMHEGSFIVSSDHYSKPTVVKFMEYFPNPYGYGMIYYNLNNVKNPISSNGGLYMAEFISDRTENSGGGDIYASDINKPITISKDIVFN